MKVKHISLHMSGLKFSFDEATASFWIILVKKFQAEAVASSNENFSPDIFKEICLSFIFANISQYMSGSKITIDNIIEEIRVHL